MLFGSMRLHASRQTPRRASHHRLLCRRPVDDAPGSLYAAFTDALAARWNVEDEGPVSDLLNVEIRRHDGHVTLTKTSYISHIVATFLANGVPAS
eukprot:151723-Pleurochrysis_carterae.AAC.1